MNKEIKVSDPQETILHSTAPANLFLAGVGSGKTTCAGLLSADFVLNFPKAIGLIGANTYQQLTKSTLKNIFETWLTFFDWRNGIDYVVDKIPPKRFKQFGAPLKSYENTISFDNGALIYTASLDNYKAIDGTEIGWALLDETKDTREEAIKDVIVWRLRQKAMYILNKIIYDYEKEGSVGYCPLFIFTSPAKVDWINEWFGLGDKYEEISRKIFSKTDYFHYEDDSKCVVISSTYHNQDNLPPGYIEEKIKQFTGNQDKIDMLIYGSPIAKSGGEFFNQFKRLSHVCNVPFLEDVNVHISLDFNVVPYVTMTCWQIVKNKDRYQVRCYAELCLSSPQNNTEDLAKEFAKQYIEKYDYFPSLFYYGDHTGKNSSTLSKEHNYDILVRILRKYLNESSDRVISRNPSVVATRDFINKIFAGGLPIDIIIDNKCKNLIADLEFLKEGPDGGKLIVHAKDQVTKQKYEKYGHTSDTLRYFLCSAFSGLFEKD